MQDSEHRDQQLTAALRGLAEDEARLGVSLDVEARLLAEVRSIGSRRRRRKYLAMYTFAAAVVLAVSIPAWRLWLGQPPVTARPVSAESPTVALSDEAATEFLPLTYRSGPIGDAQIVRLAVPRTALASFGLAPNDSVESVSSGTVLADVLVGEDGLARAVRFVRPVTN
jgi:hypothetical protein